MKLRQLHFPIFFLLLILVLGLNSCSKNKAVNQYENYLNKAENYFYTKKWDSAFYNYNQAKLACNPKEDNDRIIYTLIKMAEIQRIENYFIGSESTATEALSYFNNTINPIYKSSIYNLLGLSYQELFSFKESVFYFEKGLMLTKEKLNRSIIKNNIAVTYIKDSKYEKAIATLLPLIDDIEVKNSDENYARILDNLGYAFFKMNDDSKAIHYLLESLRIREKINDTLGIVSSNNHLGEYYENKDPLLAYEYAKKTYAISKQNKLVDGQLVSATLLIKLSPPVVSKKLSLERIHINDSIYKVRQIAKNQFAKMKYDSTKDRQDKEDITKRYLFSLNAIAFLIVIFVMSYFLITSKNRKIQLKTIYDTETRIAKMLHDELANDVFSTLTFAEIQDLSIGEKKEALLDRLEGIYMRTRTISKENTFINTDKTFSKDLTGMISSYITTDVNVITRNYGVVDWDKVKPDKKVAIYRILQELLVNMKKHSKCSLVVIGFEAKGNKIEINYSDNGIGCDYDSIEKNGLLNIENRINAIKGKINFKTKIGKGFKVDISFYK